MLDWEDATLSGKITVDAGGRTRLGIAERFHPELTETTFYTSMGIIPAVNMAVGIYKAQYAEPLSIAEMANQNIANKMLSLGVNVGIKRAAMWLQAILKIKADGSIGAFTLMALSDADPLGVLAALKERAVRFYVQDVQDHPELEPDLKGWLARANA